MDPPLPRQESSGALPEIADVQPADMERYIKPIIKEMYAEIKSAVKEHMALVKSQALTRKKLTNFHTWIPEIGQKAGQFV